MRYWSAVVILTAISAVAQTGSITGTVVDQEGSPVKSMQVEVWPVGVGLQGGVPRAETDEKGRFVLGNQLYGSYTVTPIKDTDDFYPDLSSSFFATKDSQPTIVTLTPQTPDAVVHLRLGPKAGALKGKVTDAVTGALLRPHFELAWAGEPGHEMGRTTRPHYRILLPPNTDVTMKAMAQGYKTWYYPGVIDESASKPLRLEPGQEMHLDIQLSKE